MSDIKRETMEFIRKFFEANGRPPRLKELTEKFGKSNKAILDRLSRLEKKGYIEMPDGVLSMKIKKVEYDLFFSYSSKDQDIAQKIYDFFVEEGFRVWKDNMNLSTADDFLIEIFDNIKRSRCVLVLLSKSALESKFVRSETACAKKGQIDSGKPYILPVRIAEDFSSKDIFPEISSIQYHSLPEGFQDKDLASLADRVHILAYEHRISKMHASLRPRGLKKFLPKVNADIEESIKTSPPPNKTFPYREMQISPLGNKTEFKNAYLEDLMNKAQVQIQGWGGERFPDYYYRDGHDAVLMDGWIKCSDTKAWPGREWGFSYWAVDKHLNFCSRSVLREEFIPNDPLGNKFSLDWLLLDVVRPFIFAKNLMELTNIKNWKVSIKYHGIKGRELVILSSKKNGFYSSYMSHENEFTRDFEVNDSSNLEEMAFSFCFELLRIFNWRKPNEEMLERDIRQLFEGTMPR